MVTMTMGSFNVTIYIYIVMVFRDASAIVNHVPVIRSGINKLQQKNSHISNSFTVGLLSINLATERGCYSPLQKRKVCEFK